MVARILPLSGPPDPAPDLAETPEARPETTGRTSMAAALLEPLLVPAAVAGPLCGRSEASWWRDHAARRVPAPVRLGGSTLWRVAELRAWVGAGCPDRRT